MVLFLFPIIFLLSIIFLIASGFSRKPFLKNHRFFFRSLFVGLFLTFLFSLSITLLNPYWIENGVEVRLVGISQYLFVTILAASIYQLLIVPIVIGLLHIVHNYRKKQQDQEELV